MNKKRELTLTLLFEVALAIVLLMSTFGGYMYPAVTALVSMMVMALPWLAYNRGWLHLPWAVTLAIGIVLVLHSVGIAFRFYDLLWWWDTMTHLMATLIIALLTALALMSADRVVHDLTIPPNLVPVVTLSAIILFGVIWEVLEFIFDGTLGLTMQYSLDDTANDLSFDILGGGLVALASVPMIGLIKQASQDMFLHSRPSELSPADR